MSIRPFVYTIILVTSLLGAYAYKLRAHGIFACSADGYGENIYLADCNASAYGDYDHGAFWLRLEPGLHDSVADADVLFLGSSQLQFAFSTPVTVEWFRSAAAKFYLLGFTHTENVNFIGPLLEEIRPQAKAYVINVDRFFHYRETPPVAELFHGDDVAARYLAKSRWQGVHQFICTRLPSICGRQLAIFRSRDDGYWRLTGSAGLQAAAVADGPATDQQEWGKFAEIGERFVESLPVDRSCVLLTIAPWSATRIAEATSIADAVGLTLVAPRISGLSTYDGSHLDGPSRERWAGAFFEAAGPRIQRCLDGTP